MANEVSLSTGSRRHKVPRISQYEEDGGIHLLEEGWYREAALLMNEIHVVGENFLEVAGLLHLYPQK